MYDHEIRWSALVPLALVVGLAALFAEIAGFWGKFPARPDWLWILAFYAAMRATPVPSITAFAWCGFVRDVTLGSSLGSGAIAFVLTGWIALYWKPLASTRGWPGQAVTVGAGGFLVGVIRHGLDAGWLFPNVMDAVFFVSLGDGLLTSLAFIPLAIVFSLSPIRPWRERTGLFL